MFSVVADEAVDFEKQLVQNQDFQENYWSI